MKRTFSPYTHTPRAVNARLDSAFEYVNQVIPPELLPVLDTVAGRLGDSRSFVYSDYSHALKAADRRQAACIYTAVVGLTPERICFVVNKLADAGLCLDHDMCLVVRDALASMGLLWRVGLDPAIARRTRHDTAWRMIMHTYRHTRPRCVVKDALTKVSHMPTELIDLVCDYIDVPHGRRKAVRAMESADGQPPPKRPRLGDGSG